MGICLVFMAIGLVIFLFGIPQPNAILAFVLSSIGGFLFGWGIALYRWKRHRGVL